MFYFFLLSRRLLVFTLFSIALLFSSLSAPSFAQDSTGIHSLSLLHLLDQVWDVAVQGNYAYAVCDDSGLCVVNISNPRAPTLVNHIRLNGWAQQIVLRNDRAYIACRAGGIASVNISIPDTPRAMNYFTLPGINVRGICIRDTILYAAADTMGLLALSTANMDTLRQLGSIHAFTATATPGAAYRLCLRDSLAYVAAGTAGLKIVDIANPTNMSLVGTYCPTIDTSFRSIVLFRQVAYCGNYMSSASSHRTGVYAVDIGNPLNPSYLAFDQTGYSTSGQDVGPLGLSTIGSTVIGIYSPALISFGTVRTDTLIRTARYMPAGSWIYWNICIRDTLLFIASDSAGLRISSCPDLVMNSENREYQTPNTFRLEQNYPNPFNPTTTIRYTLKSQGLVDLRVFDINGREISTLVHEKQETGYYSTSFDGAKLPSGVYWYRLRAGQQVETRKMVLMK